MKTRGVTPFKLKECKRCLNRYNCIFTNSSYNRFKKNRKSIRSNLDDIPMRKRIQILLGSVVQKQYGFGNKILIDEFKECKLYHKMGIYFKKGLLWPEQSMDWRKNK